jgi:hypothetical protein
MVYFFTMFKEFTKQLDDFGRLIETIFLRCKRRYPHIPMACETCCLQSPSPSPCIVKITFLKVVEDHDANGPCMSWGWMTPLPQSLPSQHRTEGKLGVKFWDSSFCHLFKIAWPDFVEAWAKMETMEAVCEHTDAYAWLRIFWEAADHRGFTHWSQFFAAIYPGHLLDLPPGPGVRFQAFENFYVGRCPNDLVRQLRAKVWRRTSAAVPKWTDWDLDTVYDIYIYTHIYIYGGFLKWGYPIYHPLIDGFSIRNHLIYIYIFAPRCCCIMIRSLD